MVERIQIHLQTVLFLQVASIYFTNYPQPWSFLGMVIAQGCDCAGVLLIFFFPLWCSGVFWCRDSQPVWMRGPEAIPNRRGQSFHCVQNAFPDHRVPLAIVVISSWAPPELSHCSAVFALGNTDTGTLFCWVGKGEVLYRAQCCLCSVRVHGFMGGLGLGEAKQL